MTIFYLPDLGEGLAEAEIHAWHVKEGEVVAIDQPLVAVETAKAVVDVPAPQAGRIVKLYGKTGEKIKTHAPLVEFAGQEPAVPLQTVEKGAGAMVGRLEVSQHVLNESGAQVGAAQTTAAVTVKAMPAVRALAKQLKVDIASVIPSGPQGQVTADDVKKYASLAPSQGETLHGVRHFMALAMEKSHQVIVPVTVFDDADVTNWAEHTDISVRLIQAIVAGIKAEPLLNAWFDGQTRVHRVQQEINVGLAMDTADGLFVPVLRNSAQQSAQELRANIDQFKKSVQERTIAPHDLQGATITLSNVGTIAGRYSTPIILPPMVAILASGRSREVVAVHEGKIAIRRVIPLSLTFDHRVVTGGEAARFLAAVIESLQK